MELITSGFGYALIGGFTIVMIGLTMLFARARKWTSSRTGFLVAGGDVPWTLAAPSIAASWIWAPALFVSVQKAYELGLPGIFWFTAPNVVALMIFALLAPRVRRELPNGFTLPQWMHHRLQSRTARVVYLIPVIWYQIMAITVQVFVGGMMLNFVTGIDLNVLMVLMLVIALSYSLISGLRASIMTDFVQMALILIGGAIIIPWIIMEAGTASISTGLGGLADNRNILDPHVAFTFGVVTSIGLIAGALSDQQYWQRSFAIRKSHLIPAFVLGGLMFGIVPIGLSVLGFIAADPNMGISLPEGTGLPMIGIATAAELLPQWAALFFVVMLLAGLTSTLDSGLCAAGALFAVDVWPSSSKTSGSNEAAETEMRAIDRKTAVRARLGMLAIAILGLLTAFVVQHLFSLDRLWWIFNGFASVFAVPTVMSLFYKRLTARGVIASIALGLVGMLGFVYGNWIENDLVTVGSAVFIVTTGVICCVFVKGPRAARS